MRKILLLCSAALTLATPAWSGPGDLKLTIGSGRVTLIADNVPVRTILQEWARLGQSTIVNGEKVLGAPVTLRLIDVPEAEALDIVLRSASGYLAAPRSVEVANASRFDRIVILATSRPTAAAPPTPSPVTPQPHQPFPGNPAVTAPVVEEDEEPEEEEMPQNPGAQMPVTADRPGPIPAPTPNAPSGAPAPAGQQQMPVTSARPGAIQPPSPQQPRQQPPPPPRPIPQQ